MWDDPILLATLSETLFVVATASIAGVLLSRFARRRSKSTSSDASESTRRKDAQ